MEKLRIPYTIIVEGKYDRLRLLSVCDARIITTDGFGIFKKNEKLALIRRLSEKMPIIILTDSDGICSILAAYFEDILSRYTGCTPPFSAAFLKSVFIMTQ